MSNTIEYDSKIGRCAVEKQVEKDSQVTRYPTFTFDDVLALQCCMKTAKEVQKDEELHKQLQSLHDRLHDAYWLEKQGYTKSADKAQPKFKIGDWVVSNINSGELLHIVDKDDKNYKVKRPQGNTWVPSIGYVDEQFHLWTIQGAKDGDILASNGNIILFKEISNSARKDYKYIQSHCLILAHSSIFYTGGSYNLDDRFHPATKEQREILFQKMKEAGYEWDANNKELKNYENKTHQEIEKKDCIF